jgi:plastocyanin
MKPIFATFALILLSVPALASDLPVYNLTAKNGRFEPELLEMPAGKKVQLIVKNEGPGAEEFESTDLNREKVVAPGKSITLYLGPLKEGSYTYFGDFHPDTAKGKIVVK